MSGKPHLTLVKRIRAPREIVWRAWTDPKRLALWWGPRSIETLSAEADARVGGAYRIAMRADGKDYVVSGVYQQVSPPEMLVFTWGFGGERESLVTVRLRADGDGTEVTLTHEGAADDAVIADRREGWTKSLSRLAHHLED